MLALVSLSLTCPSGGWKLRKVEEMGKLAEYGACVAVYEGVRPSGFQRQVFCSDDLPNHRVRWYNLYTLAA